jgi:hypothetical protein
MYTTYVVRSYIQILTGSADLSPGSVVLQQMAVKYCVSNYSDSLESGLRGITALLKLSRRFKQFCELILFKKYYKAAMLILFVSEFFFHSLKRYIN